MVYGDNKPHNVALVVANLDAVKKQLGTSGDADSMLSDSKVRDFFKGETREVFGEI